MYQKKIKQSRQTKSEKDNHQSYSKLILQVKNFVNLKKNNLLIENCLTFLT